MSARRSTTTTRFGAAAFLVAASLSSSMTTRADNANSGPRFFRAPFASVADVPNELVTPDGRPITVLDARARALFDRGHIAGAQHAEWTRYRDRQGDEGRLPQDLEKLARDLADLGVDDNRPVLVCGDSVNAWGEEGRIAWTLRYLGHQDVAILDGGCAAWAKAGRALTTALSRPVAGKLTLRKTSSLRVDKSALRSMLGEKDVVLLDVRTRAEYDGATPFGEARGGHLPGARHLEFKALLDDKGRVKDAAALRAELAALGVGANTRVIAYCTGGVRSAMAVEVLRANGVDAANYDGSFWEWARDPALPVEKAPPPKEGGGKESAPTTKKAP